MSLTSRWSDLGIAIRGGQRSPHLGLDELATAVVSTESATGVLDDPGGLLGAQPDITGAKGDHQVVSQRPFAVVDRLIDHVGHALVALDPSRRRAVGADVIVRPEELHAGHEVGEHDLLDTGFAQRRQHALDVPQEHAVRSDDEHSLVLEREPMRVEQVRSTVQGHNGLARTRATLHDEHPVLRRADDLVLLALDRGDDVSERPGAPTLERGEQRRVAAQAGSVGAFGPGRARRSVEAFVVAEPEVSLPEEFVLEPQQLATLDREVPPPKQPHRAPARGTVERLGHGRAPIDDHRLAVLVGDSEPADVEALDGVGRLGGTVDTTEHERRVAEVEISEPFEQGLVEGVSLEPGLERATEVGLGHVAHSPGSLATRCRDTRTRGRCRPVRQRDRGAAGS